MNDLSGSAHPVLASTGFTSGSIQNPSITRTSLTGFNDSNYSFCELHTHNVKCDSNVAPERLRLQVKTRDAGA